MTTITRAVTAYLALDFNTSEDARYDAYDRLDEMGVGYWDHGWHDEDESIELSFNTQADFVVAKTLFGPNLTTDWKKVKGLVAKLQQGAAA